MAVDPIENLRAGLKTWWAAQLSGSLSSLGPFSVGPLGSPKSKPAEEQSGSHAVLRFASAILNATTVSSRFHTCPVTFEVYGISAGDAASKGQPLLTLLTAMERDLSQAFALTAGSVTGVRVGQNRTVQLLESRWRVEYDVAFTTKTNR